MYGDFSIKEAESIGQKFKVICKANYAYEEVLSEGKEYEITIEPRILPVSPICSFINDKGVVCRAHLQRFSKIGVKNE